MEMELDARACYRALRTRDPRFDGRFFTGVVTTGVYCRPVCPARTPRAENCRFFPHAAAAAAAGFRPCLRCRPEAAPGTPVWNGTASTVARALRLIDAGAMNGDGVESLAERVGVGDRHLRRLFLRHVGATPVAVAQTQRVSFAKQLLDDTSLPMTAVARAAGFASIRRFNAAMQAAYRRPPSELRRRRKDGDAREHAAARSAGAATRSAGTATRSTGVATRSTGATTPSTGAATPAVTFSLGFRPPYDWDALLSYLSTRAIPGVETVRDRAYWRTFQLDLEDRARASSEAVARGVLEVRCDVRARRLRVAIYPAPQTRFSPRALYPIATRLRQQFDLQADPAAIASVLAQDPLFARTVRRRPGLRVPGAWDGFELAVRAVVGQQVSVRAATTVAGRIARMWGEPLAWGAGDAQTPRTDVLAFVFPTPAVLAAADLRTAGLTRARAETVRALAEAVASGRIALGTDCDADATIAALLQLPGIGPWTAAYIAMRALRVPDAFPVADLGLRRAFGALRAARGRAGAGHRSASATVSVTATTTASAASAAPAAALERASAAWKPWRAYAAVHLWTSEDCHAPLER